MTGPDRTGGSAQTPARERIVAVIPALDEEGSIGTVVRELAAHVDAIVVVDNGSRDDTSSVAASAGADVVSEPQRGYGRACLAGIARAKSKNASVVLFLDADGSDDPADAPRVLSPIVQGDADFVLGIRTARSTEPNAMTSVQRFGNWLAPALMRALVGARYSDMPPFKAIRVDALDRLVLEDQTYGFTIELLLKAHAARLRTQQIEVACRARTSGVSKVSGTVRGTVRATTRILSTIGRYAVLNRLRSKKP
jgi:glycosyltransferase involved in cell wall biosynthesis